MLRPCEICGSQEVRYVCGRCGRQVCARDFRSDLWLCASCEPAGHPDKAKYSTESSLTLSRILFASFAMILAGMILMMLASYSQSGGTSGGAIILIGPIPIVLGSGPESAWLILLGTVFTIVTLAFFLLSRRGR